MDLKYKKSVLVENMGFNVSFPTTYGEKSQKIKLTERQFQRLIENYSEYEEVAMDEMNFGDGDYDGPDNFRDEDFNEDTHDSGEVIGVDSDIRKQRELDECGDDTDDLDGHIDNVLNYEEGTLGGSQGTLIGMDGFGDGGPMGYEELATNEYMSEAINKTYRMIRETIKRERPRTLRFSHYSTRTLNEQFYGGNGNYNNPGVNAAAGIENIVKNIKKAYNFIKDSKTRKQIENTLVKLQNFMSITSDAVMAGKQQRAPRRNDQLRKPLPWPDLDEPEGLEDVDDEISL